MQGPGHETSRDVDLLVLGSGVAGLTAALTATLTGLRVIVLDHAARIGGTSARSSGTVWVPDNHYMKAQGITGDRELAAQYLASLVGKHGPESPWRTYLDQAPRMLRDLETRAGIGFRPYMAAPDYRQDHAGAAKGGRPLEPLPFDGRLLGEAFDRVAWPLPELMLFGGMMITRGEAASLLRVDRSLASMALGLRLVGRYLRDRLTYPRGTRLVLGNALVARLFKALADRGGTVLTGVESHELLRDDGRIAGILATVDGKPVRFLAGRGVILAGGGFPASRSKRAEHLPKPVAEYSPAAEGSDGSTLDLALAKGAALGPAGLDNAFWFPSSIATRADGSTAVYPHIVLDRSKPGLIAVDHQGKRFVNEAVSYHEFVRAMYLAHATTPAIPAWLICDRPFIRRHGLGLIRPRTPSLKRYIDSGYVQSASTIQELAERIGLPGDSLMSTVERFNAFAGTGVDQDFHKGDTIYDQSNGDPSHRPNPCLGPIRTPPFFALPILPTPLGTSRGLVTDTHGRVRDETGHPMAGLYACGNDMQSIFGGEYPGAGAQLGQAMTYGWIAARHAAGLADD